MINLIMRTLARVADVLALELAPAKDMRTKPQMGYGVWDFRPAHIQTLDVL